ncbi:MAG: PhzF family phenazine biosynthesis protein, partial [Solimonas sp.]
MARLTIPYFVVDAFAEKPFSGNPAGICVLDRWLPAEAMQAIAAENGLPVTAFMVGDGDAYAMRWFTPVVEEEMCGHATLGAGWVVLNRLAPDRERVVFAT